MPTQEDVQSHLVSQPLTAAKYYTTGNINSMRYAVSKPLFSAAVTYFCELSKIRIYVNSITYK